MVLIGDEAQVEARFSPFEEVLILMQDWCTGCAKRTTASENHFGCTLSNFMETWVIWNFVWVRLKIILVSEQDSCTVCTKHTVG
jgi:hypothetical protein